MAVVDEVVGEAAADGVVVAGVVEEGEAPPESDADPAPAIPAGSGTAIGSEVEACEGAAAVCVVALVAKPTSPPQPSNP